jgi:hypothetical protein
MIGTGTPRTLQATCNSPNLIDPRITMIGIAMRKGQPQRPAIVRA